MISFYDSDQIHFRFDRRKKKRGEKIHVSGVGNSHTKVAVRLSSLFTNSRFVDLTNRTMKEDQFQPKTTTGTTATMGPSFGPWLTLPFPTKFKHMGLLNSVFHILQSNTAKPVKQKAEIYLLFFRHCDLFKLASSLQLTFSKMAAPARRLAWRCHVINNGRTKMKFLKTFVNSPRLIQSGASKPRPACGLRNLSVSK